MRRRMQAVGLLATVAMLVVGNPVAAAADPPNPSDTQIATAQQDSQALAAQLGALQAQAVAVQNQIDTLQASADTAVARYDQTTRDVVDALAAADQAATDLTAARARVVTARKGAQAVAVRAYQNRSTDRTASLLLAPDPSDVDFAVAATTYLSQRDDRQLSALTVTNVAAANADARRRSALAQAQTLQQQADIEQRAALGSLQQSRSAGQQLAATLSSVNDQAAHASALLSGLQDQRAAYDAYQAQLAQQAAARAAQAREAAAAAAVQAATTQAAAHPQSSGSSDPAGDGAAAPPPASPPASSPASSSSAGSSPPSPPPPSADPSGSWVLPLNRGSFSISTCYCMRWGVFHHGIDMAAPFGTPIYAVGPGTVIRSGSASGFGNWVVIDHGDGTVSAYGHMKVLVARVGQNVGAGTLIAYVGSEGESTGPHLHFEVRVGGPMGPSTDPVIWLARRGVFL